MLMTLQDLLLVMNPQIIHLTLQLPSALQSIYFYFYAWQLKSLVQSHQSN